MSLHERVEMSEARLQEAEDARTRRERAFHTARVEHDDRDAQPKYYDAIGDCFEDYAARVAELARDADILEYGCAYGANLRRLAETARSATGIDISDVAIEKGRKQARAAGLDNVHLHAMDAERMSFADDSFDLIFGSGIIHHLDIARSLAEIARVLRPGGRAVFVEPLGHNPTIGLYRRRAPDGHPLLRRDFTEFDKLFSVASYRFYGLSTLAVVPFRRSAAKRGLFKAMRTLDRALFALPAVKWWAWYALIEVGNIDSRPLT